MRLFLYTLMSFILQAVPEGITEQFDGAVEQLSKSSVELAEAAADFGALKVIFGVFMVFFLILILMFLYQMLTMARKVNDIHGSCRTISTAITETQNRTLGRPQANILIRRSFNQLSQSIKYTILRTRLENHLDQEEYIRNKVQRLVNHEYQELNAFLMNYECDGKSLASHINIDDAKTVYDFVIEQIYLGEDMFTIASMDQAADIITNGLKLEATKGIE